MATCKFNQYGFCKFGTHCRKHHIMDICPIYQCMDKVCTLRHPRACRFFFQFGRCKFGDLCAYLHNSSNKTLEDEIKVLKSEVESIKARNSEIESLLYRMSLMETEINTIREVCAKISKEPPENFVCEHCDYKASSSSVLKRHITIKHKKNSTQTSCNSESSTAISRSSPVLPTSTSPFLSFSSTSTSASSKPPIACSRSFYGCPNSVSQYEDKDAAICPTCKLMLANKLNSSPFPSNLCPSCHEPSCGLPFSFCQECMDDLKTELFLESRWGFWHFDSKNGETVCINLDFS